MYQKFLQRKKKIKQTLKAANRIFYIIESKGLEKTLIFRGSIFRNELPKI
jgi:hypothetical protein